MAEDDCEIEYLDEDEDIIQQFVQNTPVVETKPTPTIITTGRAESDEDKNTDEDKKTDSLLVARKRSDVKRKIKSEDDSDYDPSEEFRQAAKKRKKNVKNQPHVQTQNKAAISSSSLSQDTTKPAQKLEITKRDVQERRKKGIRIPDFEDPLCFSAKAICKTKSDVQKLKYWNKICMEHYKKNFEPFRPSKDLVVSSSRTTILKKIQNKGTGKDNISVWTKINVEDSKGKERSEVNQYTLPYFRERLVLKPYALTKCTPRRFSHKHEVLLTKETNKDEDFLVAYNPGDAVTAVYKEFKQGEMETELAEAENKQPRLVIKETTCHKTCAPCYQTSWRGVRKRDNTSIQCAICKRNVVSVYNLLAHVKAHHKPEEVRRYKAALARSLASVVDYHYKCRICQETFLSIKLLRKHVAKHQGEELFHCEIGNHVAK